MASLDREMAFLDLKMSFLDPKMSFLDTKIASHDLKLSLLQFNTSLRQFKTSFLRLHRSFLHLNCSLLRPHVPFLQKYCHFFKNILISCNEDVISSPARLISPEKFPFLGMKGSFHQPHGSFLVQKVALQADNLGCQCCRISRHQCRPTDDPTVGRP